MVNGEDMNTKTIEELAKEEYSKISMFRKVWRWEEVFVKGYESCEQRESEGFEEFTCKYFNNAQGSLTLSYMRDSWQAAKLGSAREIEELRDSLSKAHLHMEETGNYYADKTNELKSQVKILKEALDRLSNVSTIVGSTRYIVIEALKQIGEMK